MINLIIILSVLCSSVAQIALKKGMTQCDCSFAPQISNILPLISALALNLFVLTGVLLHILALFTWLYVLRHVEVSYAYPFISMGFVVVLLLSYLLFNESINIYRICGVALIIIGIFLIGKSATSPV
jgi:drug/metabolite transporter (DMT)-like permease